MFPSQPNQKLLLEHLNPTSDPIKYLTTDITTAHEIMEYHR